MKLRSLLFVPGDRPERFAKAGFADEAVPVADVAPAADAVTAPDSADD